MPGLPIGSQSLMPEVMMSQFVVRAPETPSVPVVGSEARFPVHRIYCVGRNYADHAIEMGASGREPPFFFMKPADAVLPVGAGGGEMAYPSLTTNLHHELELVVAIGQGGRDIPVAQALDHVYGYAMGLDLTRRDLQDDMKQHRRPWCISKGFDQSAPLGPITPAAQVPQVQQMAIRLDVNGTVRQSGSTDQMIWNVAEIIAQASQAWALQPGDLIFTGTPAGVGAVVPGDVLTVWSEGLTPFTLRIGARVA